MGCNDMATIRRTNFCLLGDIKIGDEVFVNGVYREVGMRVWNDQETLELTFKPLIN